jgi:hypothetical protein
VSKKTEIETNIDVEQCQPCIHRMICCLVPTEPCRHILRRLDLVQVSSAVLTVEKALEAGGTVEGFGEHIIEAAKRLEGVKV